MKPLPPTEVKYQWRHFATAEGEDRPRLLIPWSDPYRYEFAFDFIFDTIEEAVQGLKDWDGEEDARSEGWILCRVTAHPVAYYSEQSDED